MDGIAFLLHRIGHGFHPQTLNRCIRLRIVNGIIKAVCKGDLSGRHHRCLAKGLLIAGKIPIDQPFLIPVIHALQIILVAIGNRRINDLPINNNPGRIYRAGIKSRGNRKGRRGVIRHKARVHKQQRTAGTFRFILYALSQVVLPIIQSCQLINAILLHQICTCNGPVKGILYRI